MYTINYTPAPDGKRNPDFPLSWVGPKEAKEIEVKKPYFVAEISELGQISNMGRWPNLGVGVQIKIVNKLNNNTLTFRCFDVDLSDSREDIAGWRFRLVNRDQAKFDCDLLIIND